MLTKIVLIVFATTCLGIAAVSYSLGDENTFNI